MTADTATGYHHLSGAASFSWIQNKYGNEDASFSWIAESNRPRADSYEWPRMEVRERDAASEAYRPSTVPSVDAKERDAACTIPAIS